MNNIQKSHNMSGSQIQLPLVTIRVSTYRSSNTVIETLESIKAQTYQNIELIISDDCSPDNTVEVCYQWLEKNQSRFVNAELVTSPVNTGVSENINRGTSHSHGEWIKGIAGDDLLIPTAIEEYMDFITSREETINIVVSDVELFSTDGDVPQNRIQEYENYFRLENRPFAEQWLETLQHNIFVGPGYIYSRKLFDEVGGFSSEYGNSEEWPFVYKVLKSGNRIFAINKKLVRYRFSLSSLSHQRNDKGLRNKELELATCRFFFEKPYHDLISERHYLMAWDRYLFYKLNQKYYESDGLPWYALLLKYYKWLSPYAYLKRMKKISFNYVNI